MPKTTKQIRQEMWDIYYKSGVWRRYNFYDFWDGVLKILKQPDYQPTQMTLNLQ